MIKLSRFLKNFSNERNFSSFFYFILRNLSLFFFTTNDHEISGTKFYNSCKFKKSIQRVSIEYFNLTYQSTLQSTRLALRLVLQREWLKKKKEFFIFPFPLQVASPCLSHATSNYLVYTPVHSRTKARGGGGGREGGRGSTDIRLRVAGRSKRVVVAGENLNRFENRARN